MLGLLTDRRPVTRIVFGVSVVLAFIVIALVILVGLEPPDSSIQVSTLEFVIAADEVHPKENLIVSAGNVTLYVPNDAIDVAGSIAITTREPNLFSLEGEGWSRPNVVNIEFRSAEGLPLPLVVLAKPAQVCFKITQDQWLDYLLRPDEYLVQFYDQLLVPAQWVPIGMAEDAEQNQLCGLTDHLSLFALAIKTPQSEIPFVDVTPTSKPNTFFDLLNDFFGQDTQDTDGQSGGVYEP